MVSYQKAATFGIAAWFLIAIIGALLPLIPYGEANLWKLLLIPISAIIIIIFAIEYLKDIHAQYEQEGIELALVWSGIALFLEIVIFGIFYGLGFDHFLNLGTWLGIAFKFVFPLAAGMYLQHTIQA